MLGHGAQRAVSFSVIKAESREDADALDLDVDPSFMVARRADHIAVVVVRAPEPSAVPAVLVHGGDHLLALQTVVLRFIRMPASFRDHRHLF